MKIRIVNRSRHSLLSYETIASAGMDLRAFLNEEIVLIPAEVPGGSDIPGQNEKSE